MFFFIIFNVFCEALYYYIALNVQYVLVQCVFDEHSFVINVTHWTRGQSGALFLLNFHPYLRNWVKGKCCP